MARNFGLEYRIGPGRSATQMGVRHRRQFKSGGPEQTLGNASALGIRAALTGPITRGDRGTLQSHLATLRAHAPGVLPLYEAAAEWEITLAEARGALTPEAAKQLRTSLATGD